jgi:hypothetical protein
VESRTVKVPLPDGDFAIVDEADYRLVANLRWRKSQSPRSSVLYIRTWSARINGRREEIAMHRLIAGAAPGLRRSPELIDPPILAKTDPGDL